MPTRKRSARRCCGCRRTSSLAMVSTNVIRGLRKIAENREEAQEDGTCLSSARGPRT